MCGSVNAVEGNSPRGHVEGQSMQHKGDLQGRKVIRFCDYVDPRTFVAFVVKFALFFSFSSLPDLPNPLFFQCQ